MYHPCFSTTSRRWRPIHGCGPRGRGTGYTRDAKFGTCTGSLTSTWAHFCENGEISAASGTGGKCGRTEPSAVPGSPALLRWQRLDSRKTMGVYSDYRDYASTLYNDPEQRPEMVKSLLVEKVGIEKVRVNP